MILTAVPGDIASSEACPAPISPTTGRCTGWSEVAGATSAWTTAYPSIAELSKPGRATADRTSSAAASPNASINGWSNAGSGSIAERMRSRCSSTESSSSVMLQDATGRDSLGCAGLQADLADHLDLRTERPVAADLQRGRLAQARSPFGETALELRHQLVVRRVELDVGHVAGRVEDEVLAHVVDVGAEHEQVAGGLHRDEPVAADLDRAGPVEELDGSPHRGLDLHHLW